MKIFKVISRKVVLRSLCLLASVLFFSCASSPTADFFSREGAKFNRDLSLAIKSADKITIVEHSFWEDFKDSDVEVDVRTAPKYIYNSKVLSASDRAYFAAQVDKLSGAKKVYNHEGCMFAPHYIFTFYKNGKKTSTSQVSHRCEDFKWQNGSPHTQSKELFTALNAIIKKVGLNPSTNWKKRASNRYRALQKKKREKRQQAGTEQPQSDEIPFGKPVPGKEGLLLVHPYTQNQVDVEGIPSGTKIRDPQDPKGRVFRVP